MCTPRLGGSETCLTPSQFWLVLKYLNKNFHVFFPIQDPSFTFSGIGPAPIPKDKFHQFITKLRKKVGISESGKVFPLAHWAVLSEYGVVCIE